MQLFSNVETERDIGYTKGRKINKMFGKLDIRWVSTRDRPIKFNS